MSPFLPANFIGLSLFDGALMVLLVSLAYADVTRMILPNSLNALLAGIGFAQSLILDLPPLPEAAAGAMLALVCSF
jgi:Flp pilus assembly protein protease CpaA